VVYCPCGVPILQTCNHSPLVAAGSKGTPTGQSPKLFNAPGSLGWSCGALFGIWVGLSLHVQ